MPLLFAHRGGKFWESDDFSYITESIREGANIIELDVRVRDGEYIVQHTPFEKSQGLLRDALRKLEGAMLYLDVKVDLDPDQLIRYVRSFSPNPIIIGSYKKTLLRRIREPGIVKSIHVVWPWNALRKGRAAAAEWVVILPSFISQQIIKKIEGAGFTFIPAGNQIFKKHEIMRNQLRYAKWGASSISTHHVAEMKKLLETNLSA